MARRDEILAGLAPAPAPTSHWSLVPVALASGLAFVSGQVAFRGDEAPRRGVVGADLTVAEAAAEAGVAAANALYRLVAELGTLDAVEKAVRMTVYVASAPGCTEQPEVAHGASRVLVDVLGEAGRPARTAVGVAALPLGVPVEVELTVQVRDV